MQNVELDEPKARRYALYRLGKMAYFSQDLYRLLLRKGAPEDVAKRVIDALLKSEILNDALWVESFVRRQILARNGARKIALQLKQRGVPEDLFLEHLPEDLEEQETLEELIETRYKNRDFSDYHEKQKVKAALARKGFSFDAIDSVLNG